MTNFDEIFRQKLSSARAALPQDDWVVLEKKYAWTRRRRRIVRASLCSLAAAAIALVIFLPGNVNTKLVPADKIVVAESSAVEIGSSVHTEDNANIASSKLLQRAVASNIALDKSNSNENGTAIRKDTILLASYSEPATHFSGDSTPSADSSTEDEWITSDPTNTEIHRNCTLMIGTSFSGGVPSSNSQIYDYASSPNTSSTNNNSDVQHQQPLRFSLLIGIPLTHRLNLETGLSFSQLRSEFDEKNGSSSKDIDQRLNYIGIPLGLSYCLWGNRVFRTYLSVGGMAEKMVYGTSKSSGISTSLSIAGLQYSLYGVAGFEVLLAPHLSLGFEPGVGYYYSVKGSDITTLYSDTPLNLQLRLSLKVEL